MSRHFRKANSKYTYGVLVGTVTDGQENPSGNSPHYEILINAAGTPYRIAVNVQSTDGSEVLAYYDPKYTNQTKLGLTALANGPQGFTSLQQGSVFNGLDYVRDNLFPLDQMQPIPAAGNGLTLSSLIDAQVERAKADSQAVAIAVGDEFNDGDTSEQVGFRLGRGVHDIHMMQGNSGDRQNENRANGDGALFIVFAGGETIALFLRFETQSIDTDSNGNPQ